MIAGGDAISFAEQFYCLGRISSSCIRKEKKFFCDITSHILMLLV
jgi:hypothetical protein